ncbi:lysine transporter LysE [Nocardia seriolae]|uniref:Lysine transporter LysE n=2 Tax=Nocardia seriolae TaxID=37332 RepID=A0ABC9YTN2_9NOCA|nr:lysine transporter LysE [Nocardia seriolae]GEM24428.1 lysine transporter LysE [Nocardia seriolae NBRC 15557]BEK91665.1 LysE family translocator [Nocardia seriolae]BEK99510.1 LysE family translocator [Nocardia seriolae]GAM46955.1 lysine transporter LysE [Nocardia seriolae]
MEGMSFALLLSFVGLCVLLALTPGPDTFLVLRFSMAGSRPGIAAAVGSAFGGIVWATVVAAGVAALLEQSATAYRTLKVIGGIYLVYLGIRALLAHRRGQGEDSGETEVQVAQGKPVSIRSAFAAGLLSCVFNPKVGLFYLAVLPQFLVQVTFLNTLTLGAIESTVAAIEMIVLAVAAARAVALLKRPKIRARLEQASAAILAALGIGTAASAAA